MRETPRLDVANYDWEPEDVRDWFVNISRHVDEKNAWFNKSLPTKTFPQGTMSDYYGAYIPRFGRAFIKFVIYRDCLIVTSFKEDADVV